MVVAFGSLSLSLSVSLSLSIDRIFKQSAATNLQLLLPSCCFLELSPPIHI
ncbi:MAG: hypothetical protein N7Q72_05165 [Spiroplasma sp. Tabriz.8]|nr:hypothetical protein [Spiroplasma sp. Tabriz.8]